MPPSRRTQTAAEAARPARRPADDDLIVAGIGSSADDDLFVVGIGSSAGGLQACIKLVEALPGGTGMAFILVQHLDPTHESLLAALLAGHTEMPVLQAGDGMRLEAGHFYIIPPGTYLSVAAGTLLLSPPQARHGARLPFDFLLHSLAEAYGSRAIGVVLSGSGSDGSVGIRAVKQKGGFLVAQDPAEAGYDGMPRSAIATGAVDLVLPAGEIPAALIRHSRQAGAPGARTTGSAQAGDGKPGDGKPGDGKADRLADIIDLLRARTSHDFSLYKRGTLQRRIEQRMAAAAIAPGHMERYLRILRTDRPELDLLAKSLLINVTQFFRDPKVFEFLAAKILPELVRSHAPDRPVRIWIAGCSSGEETYSLAMLLREQLLQADSAARLQLFASDVDSDAIATAREGLYSKAIEADVSPARLARFFSREGNAYRVLPELRAAVVFTVQDVLSEPPFSRIDLVSCRNLLIYLRPEAQAKVISVFHFALREGGVLVLGATETAGNAGGRFELISKADRVYRHIGRHRPGEHHFAWNSDARPRPPAGQPPAPLRQAALAELGRRLVLDSFAPAAVLINRRQECLFLLGPTDRYLHVPPGAPTQDLLVMARQGLRARLRLAIGRAFQENSRLVTPGGRIRHAGQSVSFSLDIQPVQSAGEDLLLVCFVDQRAPPGQRDGAAAKRSAPRVIELEQELEATRAELAGAVHELETSTEEHKAIHEEALSVNEEFQSTNEELLTSKEELQSLNEELTALNSQLQETLERQRTTSDDLQNVLYSTDVATLFLDAALRIRFFTPATRAIFRILPGDVGRPLSDLAALAVDADLPADARAVLHDPEPIEREIEAPGGVWFRRRMLPYRNHGGMVEGVVITFTDISQRKLAAHALEAARREAEVATVAKSRFLAAASHDLRQPLQALALLQGMLAKIVDGDRAKTLVGRLDEAVRTMSGMLNTLLDINQIESGVVRAEIATLRIDDLLARMRDAFADQARAQGLRLIVVPCGLSVASDPALLEQMLRNLLSNALKYTRRGKVLLGCRRQGASLGIEVWDTGIGIPATELTAIFDEYHQLDNAARESSLGLGLGLSIVRRLGVLLGHRVRVRSRRGVGSGFAIEVPRVAPALAPPAPPDPPGAADGGLAAPHRTGAILLVEDDPALRELLAAALRNEGHRVALAADAAGALEIAARRATAPDLLLADYNLPNGQNGLELALRLRERLGRDIPVIILTGDISTETLRGVAQQNFLQLNKPVRLTQLTQVIQTLLPAPLAPPRPGPAAAILIVDDDSLVRDALASVLEDAGHPTLAYASGEDFLAAYRPGDGALLLLDASLPEISGIEVLRRLRDSGDRMPAIIITASSDVPMAVQAMQAGAADFIDKPVGREDLLASVGRALEQSRDAGKREAWRATAAGHLAGLTDRQRQILDRVLAGQPSKNIAADLGISRRTVENHRAAIMQRTGAKSLPALARLALAAAGSAAPPPAGSRNGMTEG